MPSVQEPLLERLVVLDDAVMDDDDGAGAIEVRVCVGDGHAAVGGPARVTDPDAAGQLTAPDLGGELTNRADLLEQRETVWRLTGMSIAIQNCEARRVIAAVLQALQPFEKEGRQVVLPLANVAENSTHCPLSRLSAAEQTCRAKAAPA